MAALRMVRRCGVALATATAVPVLFPTVLAEEEQGSVGTSRMVRPTDLPIYENPEEVLDFEYHGHERTALEENIGVVRKEVEGVVESTRSARERVGQIYETGKAHSMATVDYITDEENVMPRAGAITIGGLAGLIIGARRRGGLVKKVLYTSTGVATAASLCYPRQAYQVSQKVYGQVKDYSTIGYNFVAGVKPQSKTTVPSQVAEEVPALDTSQESIPTPEGGEVRISHLLPPDKFPGAIDSLAQQASDVAQLGFRLTHPDAGQEELPLSKALEGFGSVGEVDLELNKDSGSIGKETSDVGGVSLPESPLIDQGRDGGKSLSESVVPRKEASVVKDECVADPGNRISSGDGFVEGKDVEARGKVGELDDKALKVEDEVASTHEKVEEVESKVSEVEGIVLGKEEKVEVQDKVAEVEDKVIEMEDKTAEVEGIARIPEVGTVTEGVVEKITEVEDKVAEVVGEAVGVVEAKIVQVVEETTTEVGERVGEFVGEEVTQIAGEKMGEIVKEKVTDIVEKEEEKLIGEVVYDLAEKVTIVVEEEVAGEVAEVAGEVSLVAGEVAGVVHGVEEVGEKADSALTVVDEVVEMGVKAAEDTVGVPEALTEKMEEVEKVVEVMEQVANVVTTAAGQVEGLAEEVEEKAKEIRDEAKKVQGSEEKQEEIFEEIVDYAKDKLTEAIEVKDKETASSTADVSKDMTLSMRSVNTESSVEASTQVTPVQESELATDAAARFGSIPEEQVQTEATEVEKLKHITEEEPKVDKESVETVKEASMEREGLINKLVKMFSKDKKSALEETPSEPVKESQSVIDSVSLPTTEIVNELEKVGKVSSDPDTLKETTNVEMDNSEEPPRNIVEVLEPVIENVTKEAVVKVVESVVEEASNIVKGATSEVVEYASSVVEVTDVVEEVGEKIISVMDTVQELTSDAIEDKDTPENVAAQAGKVKLVSEGVEIVAEKVLDIADKVEEVAEIVKEKVVSIEQKITELVAGSEEKREELIEDAIDFVTSKSSEETASILPQELESETISAVPHESPRMKENKEVEEETVLSSSESLVKGVSESQDAVPQPPEPVLKKGLFSTLAQIFSKKEEEKEEHQDKGQSVEILTEIVEGKPSLETNIQDIKEESIVDVGELKENIEEISDITEASTDKLEDNEGKLDETTDTIDVSETPLDTGSKRDLSVDETSSLTPDSAEVTEEKILQEEKPSQMKQLTAEAADSQVPEREGLFDKLRSLFSKDKEEGLLGSGVSQESEATPESIKIPDYADGTTTPAAETVKVSDEILTPPTKSSEYLVEILAPDVDQSEATVDTQDAVDTSGSISNVNTETGPDDTLLSSSVDNLETGDVASETSSTVVKPQSESTEPGGLIGKLVSLFTKDKDEIIVSSESSPADTPISMEPVVETIKDSDEILTPPTKSSEYLAEILAPDVDQSEATVDTQDAVISAEFKGADVVHSQPEQKVKEGLVDKLVSFFSKDEKNVAPETQPEAQKAEVVSESIIESTLIETSDPAAVDTSGSISNVNTETGPDDTLLSSSVDNLETGDVASETSSTVVKPQSESTEPGGLIGKLVSLFTKDKDEIIASSESSPADTPISMEPVVETIKDSDEIPKSPFVSSEPAVQPVVSAVEFSEPGVVASEPTVETPEPGSVPSEPTVETTDPAVDLGSQHMEKESLIDKLISVFSKDEEKKATVVTEPPETLTSELEQDGSSNVRSDIEKVDTNIEVMPTNQLQISEPENSSESTETAPPSLPEKEKIIDKIVNLFTKDEDKNEAPSGSPHPNADAVIKESVTELVDEPPKEKVETESIKEEASDAQKKVLAPMEKKGLFGKLANLFSSETELIEERKTQGTESREGPSTDPEAVKEEKPMEKANKSEINVETTPTPEELHRFTELSKEDKEHKTAEASDTSADSSTPSTDRQEDSQVQFPSVTRLEPILSDSSLKEGSRDAEPYLEIKDKSLFDRLDMLIPVDESSNNDSKLNTSKITAVEESPVDSDSQQKTQVKSTEETEEVMSSKLSKITKLFSSKETAKGLPTQEQREMASRVTEESSGKTGEDKVTMVKTEADNPPGEVREVQSEGPQDTLSPAWRGWLRTGASVKQEGKDVIVQLTPPPPPVEKDYGQSNPEDSDMYTTRD